MGSRWGYTGNPYLIPENSGALFDLKQDKNDEDEAIEFKYIKCTKISHDTFIYTYEIPKNLNLGISLGQHIAIDTKIKTKEHPEGEEVSRKYTPVSWIKEEGRFDLLIKVYFKDVHPHFPEGGKMSQYLNDLKLGSNISVRGPFGKLNYLGDGNYKILKKFNPKTYLEKAYKHTFMLAGGTGITPCYQIIQAAHKNKDAHRITLIFGNKTTKDFLLKDELDNIVKDKLFSFDVVYTIDKEEENWKGEVGFINKDMITKYGPKPSDDVMVLTCGPPIMCKNLVPILKDIGYDMNNYFDF